MHIDQKDYKLIRSSGIIETGFSLAPRMHTSTSIRHTVTTVAGFSCLATAFGAAIVLRRHIGIVFVVRRSSEAHTVIVEPVLAVVTAQHGPLLVVGQLTEAIQLASLLYSTCLSKGDRKDIQTSQAWEQGQLFWCANAKSSLCNAYFMLSSCLDTCKITGLNLPQALDLIFPKHMKNERAILRHTTSCIILSRSAHGIAWKIDTAMQSALRNA